MNENRYKKAMDDVCDKHFNLTAEEMLAKAKASAGTERDITMKKTTKRRIIGRIIGTAAACLIISGTTATALGYGPLSETFRSFFGKDETTAEIIEQGHYCNVGQEQSDGIFTVMLDSVTGDKTSPKLIFKVTVNDKVLAEKNDRLKLSAYILNEDKYYNHIDEYGTWDAYGEKDPQVNNMYHVCMDGPAAFMINEEEVIAAVKQISFENDPENQVFDYDVDMEYRFIVPDKALKDSFMDFSKDIILNSGNVEYKLHYAEYGSYDSSFGFTFDFLGNDLAGDETDYTAVCGKFDNDWHEFAKDFILSVDGVEYSPKEIGYSYCDTEGEAFEAGKCSTWMSFPSVDFESAESVELIAGGETYRLK